MRHVMKGFPPRPSTGPGGPSSACAVAFADSSARKDSRNIVISAIARELAGFVYAEMTA